MTRIEELAWVLKRLGETQQNLPVPLTAEERSTLREASRLLFRFAQWEATYRSMQQVIDGD